MSNDRQTVQVYVSWEEIMSGGVEIDVPADADLESKDVQDSIRRQIRESVATYDSIGEYVYDTAECVDVKSIQVNDIQSSNKDQGKFSIEIGGEDDE